MTTLFQASDTLGVFGEQSEAIQAMLDYDFLAGKSAPSLSCIIQPTASSRPSQAVYFFGGSEVLIPRFATLTEALNQHPFSILVNFASARSAFKVTEEALTTSIHTIVIIAENMPERQARILKAQADIAQKVIIGPATVGALIAGQFKIGHAGGTTENILKSRLYQKGSVGIVSRSGGLLNELMTMVTRTCDGVAEAIAIGGDRFPITTLTEQVQRFEANPEIKLILLLGEIGGTQEYAIAELLKKGELHKPLVAWVAGTGARLFSEPMQFGHAGAMANFENETAVAKLQALREAGALVADSYQDLEPLVAAQAAQLSLLPPTDLGGPPSIPLDFRLAVKQKKIRYSKQIQTSISKKHGENHTYFGQDIAKVSQEKSLGYILGLLWFKTEFSASVCDLFELILKVTADHGPAVAGAHNTIVTARAGKDLVSSLVAGLLPIGPRFGGAVNEAARYFKWGVDSQLPAFDFVEQLKERAIRIPGIGHRVKSKTQPDERVTVLMQAARALPSAHHYLDYALQVEEITTRKKDSLILNVDGAIAAILLDVLADYFSSPELDELIEMEALNAFFVLGRSVGLIGHFIDQKRLNQPLYRHPAWDILEVD